MKNIIYLFILGFLASCSTQKQAAAVYNTPAVNNSKTPPRFMNNISISPTSGSRQKDIHKPLLIDKPTARRFIDLNVENCNQLEFKYGILMNQPVEYFQNDKLLVFLDDWYGIPYRYGGNSKQGIDCSAFTSLLLKSVYGVSVPRTSRDQYASLEKVGKSKLEQGDLVFFNTTGRQSHVGVYLGNNKFVHASTSSGVTISDLDDHYFSSRYAGSGRSN